MYGYAFELETYHMNCDANDSAWSLLIFSPIGLCDFEELAHYIVLMLKILYWNLNDGSDEAQNAYVKNHYEVEELVSDMEGYSFFVNQKRLHDFQATSNLRMEEYFQGLKFGIVLQTKFKLDGKMSRLEEFNFDVEISNFDYICADFYVDWCVHCKQFCPELYKTVPILARLNQPITVAEFHAGKFRKLAFKYEADGHQTLMIFIQGVPSEYYGLLVRNLRRFVAPNVAVFNSDSDSTIKDSIEAVY